MKNKIKLLVVLAAVLVFSTGCTLAGALLQSGSAKGSDTGETVTISKEEYERLQKYAEMEYMLSVAEAIFYGDVDEQAMIENANRGFLYGLDDPYSFYYSPEDYAQLWEDDKGEYAGIGIQITTNYYTNICTVSRIFKDTPAQAAGIHKNDILIQVEDIDVNASTISQAVDIMRGKAGEEVQIKVLRGEEVLEFSVPRAEVKVNWEDHMMLEDGIGYLVLYQFAGAEDGQQIFQAAIDSLMAQGMKGLILDLRDNPGGWVGQAVYIADIFLPEGEVVYAEDKYGNRSYEYSKEGALDIPLVVLINQNSASASELLAGALQDYEAATIVGTVSFGKGIMQRVLDVGDGAGMQITIAQYFTPKGNKVHEVGIIPDVEIDLPEGDNGMYELGDLADVQLSKALEVLKEEMTK